MKLMLSILTVQSDEAKPFDNMRIAGSVNISMNFVDFVLVVCHIIPFLFFRNIWKDFIRKFFLDPAMKPPRPLFEMKQAWA